MRYIPPMDPASAPEDEAAAISPEILCPTCLHANAPRADFCSQCGAPLSMMATIDPIKSTLSEGFGYRQAVNGPPKLVVVIGIWLIFLPGFATTLLFLLKTEQPPGYMASGLSVAYWCFGIVVVYRSTANYFRKRAAAAAIAVSE